MKEKLTPIIYLTYIVGILIDFAMLGTGKLQFDNIWLLVFNLLLLCYGFYNTVNKK